MEEQCEDRCSGFCRFCTALITMNLRSHFSEASSPQGDATTTNGFQIDPLEMEKEGVSLYYRSRGILFSAHEARIKEVLHSRGEKNSNGSVSCQEQYQAVINGFSTDVTPIQGSYCSISIHSGCLALSGSFQSHGISQRDQRKLLSVSSRSTRLSSFLIILFRSIVTLSIVPLLLIYVSGSI